MQFPILFLALTTLADVAYATSSKQFVLRHEDLYEYQGYSQHPNIYLNEADQSAVIDDIEPEKGRSVLTRLDGSNQTSRVNVVIGDPSKDGMRSVSVEDGNGRFEGTIILRMRLFPDKTCRFPVEFSDDQHSMSLFRLVNQGKSVLFGVPNFWDGIMYGQLFTMNDDGSCASSALTRLGRQSDNKIIVSPDGGALIVQGNKISDDKATNEILYWNILSGEKHISSLPGDWVVDKFSADSSGMFFYDPFGVIGSKGSSPLSWPIKEVDSYWAVFEELFKGLIPDLYSTLNTSFVAEGAFGGATLGIFQKYQWENLPNVNPYGYMAITYRTNYAIKDDKILMYREIPKLPYDNCMSYLAGESKDRLNQSAPVFVEKDSSTILVALRVKTAWNGGESCKAPYRHLIKAYDFAGNEKYEMNDGWYYDVDLPLFKALDNGKYFLTHRYNGTDLDLYLVHTATGNIVGRIPIDDRDRAHLVLSDGGRYLAISRDTNSISITNQRKIQIYEIK